MNCVNCKLRKKTIPYLKKIQKIDYCFLLIRHFEFDLT